MQVEVAGDFMAAVAPRFMGFAEEFRAPNQSVIQPERFAEALYLRLQDLAKLAGVHRTTLLTCQRRPLTWQSCRFHPGSCCYMLRTPLGSS